MIWRHYKPCAAYHVAYQGVTEVPPNDDDIIDARESMVRDLKFIRGQRTNNGDRDTMRGLFKFWRTRL